jgi:hypothetical protein
MNNETNLHLMEREVQYRVCVHNYCIPFSKLEPFS